jgi:hypothetical protein
MKKRFIIIISGLIVISYFLGYLYHSKTTTQLQNLYNRNIKEYYDILIIADKYAQNKDESDIETIKFYMKQLRLIGKTTLIDLDTSFEEIPEFIYRQLKCSQNNINKNNYISVCEEIETVLELFNNRIISVDNDKIIKINTKFFRGYLKNIRNDIIENYHDLGCVE